MLQLSQCRPQLTSEFPLSPNSTPIEEGLGLQWAMDGNQNYITAGTGAAGVFAGVAFGYYMRPSTMAQVDTLVVPASPGPYTVTLSQIPNNVATISVVTGGAQLTYVSSTVAAGDFSATGTNNQTITVDSNLAGATLTITYRFNLTVLQAEMYTGDGYVANAPSNVTGTMGVIQKGVIFTSNYNTAIYWGAGNISNITLAANGYFTTGGSGAAVTGTVFSVPTADVPYLGLYISA